MTEYLALSTAGRQFTMLLGILFAVLAAVLAAVGIYGVTAHAVGRRTQEFGIRMAIGAQRSSILWMVLRQGLVLAFVGIVIGVLGARLATPLLATLVFGVSPTDFVTLLVVAFLLGGVALVACLWPAVRATRIDPMVALRYE
jgi:ABC-type antimicrobial peptide transport system permease subunit